MLTIKSNLTNDESIGRPIISIKDNLAPSGIISDILLGEFRRNKSITSENYTKALKFIRECHKINIFMSETNLNQIIQEALKILYNIK